MSNCIGRNDRSLQPEESCRNVPYNRLGNIAYNRHEWIPRREFPTWVMPIPPFDRFGVLPAGIWDAQIEEIGSRLGTFRGTDQRPRLWCRFLEFVRELQASRLVFAVILDGSFVTDELRPNDIDMILVLHSGHDFSATLRPFEYNLLSRRQVSRDFGFDILIAAADSSEYDEYVDFFSQIRGVDDRTKGLVRILL